MIACLYTRTYLSASCDGPQSIVQKRPSFFPPCRGNSPNGLFIGDTSPARGEKNSEASVACFFISAASLTVSGRAPLEGFVSSVTGTPTKRCYLVSKEVYDVESGWLFLYRKALGEYSCTRIWRLSQLILSVNVCDVRDIWICD